MSPKHGIALLLSPHDGDGDENSEGVHDDYKPSEEEMDAAMSFYEAAKGGDREAAAKALCSFVDLHTHGHDSEGDEDEEP